jgi:hypothetical protein
MSTFVATIVCYALLYVTTGLSCGGICSLFPYLRKEMTDGCSAAEEIRLGLLWMVAWPLAFFAVFVLTAEHFGFVKY